MKKRYPVILLLLCLTLLPACSGTAVPGNPPAPQAEEGPPPDSAATLAEDETPAYLVCRIVDGAEDGELLLAALDASLPEGHEGLTDGRSVYRLSLTGETPVYLDGKPATAGDLRDGMPVEVAFNGTVLETFPAQPGQVYAVSGFSQGTQQNPGGSLYDLCGLYLQALDDLWNRDPALNENLSLAGLDLSQAPGGLLESERSALAWRFGELHGVEVVTGTFEELAEQGYFTASEISAPAPKEGDESAPKLYEWPDGCLFSIKPNGNHAEEIYSLPTIFFDVEKWKSPLAAYVLYDCSAVWPMLGTWSGYQVGSEMIS